MKRQILTAAAAVLATGAAFAQTDLFEAEDMDETGGWTVSAAVDKAAGSKTITAEKKGDDAEQVFVTGACNRYAWVRAANLFATNEAPSKFVLQFAGVDTTVEVKGPKGKFVWTKAATALMPAGYGAFSLKSLDGTKVAIDCVLVTDSKSFVPPDDAEGLAKLRKK